MAKYTDEEVNEIAKSPWNFFVKHRKVTVLILVGILIWGLSSMFSIPRETQPEIELEFGSIFTVYPGASPLDVEELVTNELESAISSVEDIKNISSASKFGMSNIVVEFESGIDLDKRINDMEASINRIKSQLPAEAQDPMISAFEANSTPVIIFSLLSDLPEKEIKEIAEDVQNEIEKVSGVSEVKIIGARDKQILVNLNPDLLDKYQISLGDVSNAIQTSNLNFPIGEIENNGFRYSLRMEAQLESSTDLAQLPVKQFFSQDGSSQMILLRDIADLTENLEKRDTIARVGIPANDSIRDAITLQIYKKKGENIVNVAESSKVRLEELKGDIIPDNIIVHIANDNSEFVQEDLEVLGKNGITTIILIMVLLFIFMGAKEGIIAGLSIPFAMLITFGVLSMMGQTLNGLTLFSLVFALGLLIDNAVIMVEGIYENLRTKKYTSYGSAIIGIFQFKWPIIAGTLTTVLAFFPIIFVSGIMGEFMRIIPITVTTILLASLFVNLSITPTLASRFLKPGKQKNLFKGIQKWYKGFIARTLNSKFRQIVYIGLMVIVMIISFSLPLTGVLKSEAFPNSDYDFFYVDVKTPPGTILEDTEKVVSEVEQRLMKVPEIKSITTGVGTNAGSSMRSIISTTSNVTHIASLTVNLVDEDKRDQKSYELSNDIRELLTGIQGGEVTVVDLQGGPPSGAPIEGRITGPDLEKLEEIAVDIKEMLDNIEGTLDPDTSIEQSAGEFNLTLDRNKLNYYGIAEIQIAGLLRNATSGTSVSEIRRNGEEMEIILQYSFNGLGSAKDIDLSLDDITSITINSPVHGPIPLSALVDVELKQSLTGINHLNEKRVMYVTSYTKDRPTTDIIAELNKQLEKNPLPKDYAIEFGGEAESVNKSFIDLGLALLVGLLLIAGLLVLQFKSYRQPFIILLSLPFALTGVFFGLTIMGLTISIPSVIGIVGLAGVVVNDAIVLLDQMNKNRKRGMEVKKAVIEGATSRLQPVFLTTITSIFGILPLALTDELWGSLGFAFIFGLTTQFFLVLLLDPILYAALSKKEKIGIEPYVFSDEGWKETVKEKEEKQLKEFEKIEDLKKRFVKRIDINTQE